MPIREFVPRVAEYGYVAAFVGTFAEGETFPVLSGLGAYRGTMALAVLFLVGAVGAFVSDNLLFAVGRMLGPAVFARFPRLVSSASRIDALGRSGRRSELRIEGRPHPAHGNQAVTLLLFNAYSFQPSSRGDELCWRLKFGRTPR
jgi:hypothetical protein